jgi:ATP-dependent Clp protease ATP-binding subunit ClpC
MEKGKLLSEAKEKFTNELTNILDLINNDLIIDYPTKKITLDYFIVGLLQSTQTTGYKFLKLCVDTKTINDLLDLFLKRLSENSTTNTTPVYLSNNKKLPVFDETLSNILIKSNTEREKLNDLKIGSEHILLSTLFIDDETHKIFQKYGLEYLNYFNEINVFKQQELTKKHDFENISAGFNNAMGDMKSKNKKGNLIDTYCVNLNKLYKQGKIDSIVGRDNELNRLVKVLCRRSKNCAILVGLPGTGKTAIVNGLVNMIENDKAKSLNGKTIISLDISGIVAGTNFRGQLEERFNGIVNEVKANKDYVLFIDDVHTFLNGNSNQSTEIAGILSNILSDNDIKLIATTTFAGFKSAIESDSTLNRRFQKITVDPNSVSETEKIISVVKKYYETHHSVIYTEDALKACVKLANKYITDKYLPDSAIDILDECGSDKQSNSKDFDEIVKLKKEFEFNKNMVDKSMKCDDYDLADKYELECKKINAKIIDLQKKKQTKNTKTKITEDDVCKIVSEMTNIPITKLSTNDKQKYLNIEDALNAKVIGQKQAVKNIAKAVKRGRIGLSSKNQPISVILAVGESGCGKTLIAKKLAEEVFGSEEALVRFDMSEYSDKTSVNKLIGASSGYVGYEQGGLLTETIKNKKHCVLLLDEIEKSDKEVHNLLLQVFDNGVISDNNGVKVDFKNVIIIMTSNVGARDAESMGNGIGFNTNHDNKKHIVEKSLKSTFSPEFINRISNIIHFNKLTTQDLKDIIKLELNNLNKRVIDAGYGGIEYQENIVELLFEQINGDGSPGARKINRIIQTEIEDLIVDMFLEENINSNHIFNITVENNKINVL